MAHVFHKSLKSLKWIYFSPVVITCTRNFFYLLNLSQTFTFNCDRILRRTRQSNLLYVPKVRLETTKRSFYYNGCTVFNRLIQGSNTSNSQFSDFGCYLFIYLLTYLFNFNSIFLYIVFNIDSNSLTITLFNLMYTFQHII